ncbi:hypothetical protein PCASD_24604 [Puccinia coronata f. sp. avenae]|uniref:Uncharacterized protein n=1 Tax=Puccinia coronata f. sp. avenae TaxID=200324 RepID=A0A2N5TNF0_9BASI|nr:hypothetical protein PCASD_24604 [Puccinia coronata f. sp. avenae]
MFLHGQLYVALSRTSNVDNLMMVAKISESKQLFSVVHKSIFEDVMDVDKEPECKE